MFLRELHSMYICNQLFLSIWHLYLRCFSSLTVVQEQIELDDLRFQVRLDEARMQSQQVQDSNLYVIVIVKRPLIALRYQLPDGQVKLSGQS